MDDAKNNGVQAPINATRAALEAAHTRDDDRARVARAQASGTACGGARSPRLRHEQEARSSFRIKPLAVLLGCGFALLFIVVVGGAVRSAFLYEETPAEVAERELAEQGSASDVEFCSSSLDDTCELEDYVYRLESVEGGRYRLVRTSAAGNASETVLVEGKGRPRAFALKNGTFYILLQSAGSWRVESLVLGDGSLPVSLVKGRGKATGLELDGGALCIKLKDGGAKKLELD